MTEPRSLLAPNPSPMTMEGTRTYIVGRQRPVVIDPGPSIAAHEDAILMALAGATPLAIVVTHSHPDHAPAAAAVAQLTGAPVWMAAGGRGELASGLVVDHRPREGDRLRTDGGDVVVVETPGHTPDHLALHWTGGAAPAGGAVFVGDLLMGRGDTTVVAVPEGDLAAYLVSLERLEALAASTLYPAHGPTISDAEAAIRRYRDHRKARVRQVREAAEALGTLDLDRLVNAIYGDTLDPRLRDAARGSTEALLRYVRSVDQASRG